MRVRAISTVGAAAAALFLIGGMAWAQKPTAAEQRQKATERLGELEQRLERTAPEEEGSPVAMRLELGRRYLELAGKLLRQNNLGGARAMADLAERCLPPLEKPEEGQ
jgi:hypothetical protein